MSTPDHRWDTCLSLRAKREKDLSFRCFVEGATLEFEEVEVELGSHRTSYSRLKGQERLNHLAYMSTPIYVSPRLCHVSAVVAAIHPSFGDKPFGRVVPLWITINLIDDEGAFCDLDIISSYVSRGNQKRLASIPSDPTRSTSSGSGALSPYIAAKAFSWVFWSCCQVTCQPGQHRSRRAGSS